MPRFMQALFQDASGSKARVRPRVRDDTDVLSLALSMATVSDATLYQVAQQDITYFEATVAGPTPISQGATIYVGPDPANLTAIELWSTPPAAFLPDGVTIDIAWPPLVALAATLPSELQPLAGGHAVFWST